MVQISLRNYSSLFTVRVIIENVTIVTVQIDRRVLINHRVITESSLEFLDLFHTSVLYLFIFFFCSFHSTGPWNDLLDFAISRWKSLMDPIFQFN